MPSRKTGEESRLLTFARGGNISSIIIPRFGSLLLVLYSVLTSALQIDEDRAVAAGASYGGYAIKCVSRLLCWDNG